MGFLLESSAHAVRRILSADSSVVDAVATSLQLSLLSTSLAACIAIPAGYLLASGAYRGKRFVGAVLQAGMSIPTVAIGLIIYGMLSRRGVFGHLNWLYTKQAVVAGQLLLALPTTTALTFAATQSLDPRLRETAIGLGAHGWRLLARVVHEARFAYLAAILSAYGRVISEVGISMIAGGNIAGSTRTVTTAIALETSKGEFEVALALGMILVAMAFTIAAILNVLQKRSAHA